MYFNSHLRYNLINYVKFYLLNKNLTFKSYLKIKKLEINYDIIFYIYFKIHIER